MAPRKPAASDPTPAPKARTRKPAAAATEPDGQPAADASRATARPKPAKAAATADPTAGAKPKSPARQRKSPIAPVEVEPVEVIEEAVDDVVHPAQLIGQPIVGDVNDDGKAEVLFSLLAPYNESVSLIGSFTDWQPVPMERGADGYWTVVMTLPDGTYHYKFRVKSLSYFAEGQDKDIADPRAKRVDPMMGESAMFILEGGKDVTNAYAWQHDQSFLPPDHELVIYELHVGDFSGGEGDEADNSGHSKGRFQDVIDKIEYLVDLGVNAVQLMPVSEFAGDVSWGYSVRHYFAPESAYGTPQDLKRLVDTLHGRGIRVILDVVYNHTDSESPISQIDYTYWFHRESPDGPWTWGPKFNQEFFDEKRGVFPAREFLKQHIEYMVHEYHIDGIRVDAVKQINNFDVLREINQAAKQAANPRPFYSIGERIPDEPALVGPTGVLDAVWRDRFLHQLRADVLLGEYQGSQPNNWGRTKCAVDSCMDGYSSPTNLVTYLNNHDHQRLFFELGVKGIFDDRAFRRAKLAAVLTMTSYGVPMLQMGEEFGEYSEKTLARNKLHWTLAGAPRTADLLNFYRGVIRLRRQTPALQTGGVSFVLDDPERRLLGWIRPSPGNGPSVLVVANFSEQYHGFEIGNLPDGPAHEYLFGYDTSIQGGVLRDTLAESEAKIYLLPA